MTTYLVCFFNLETRSNVRKSVC